MRFSARVVAASPPTSNNRLTAEGQTVRFIDLVFGIWFEDAGVLPSYRGTTIRGAFGYALRKIVCAVPGGQCATCLLGSRCAFPVVFEGRSPANRSFMTKYPHIPQPFVLRTSLSEPRQVEAGSESTFGIRLFGPAIEFYPYVVVTVTRMGEVGLGRDRLKYQVVSVTDGTNQLLFPAELKPPMVRSVFEDKVDQSGPPRRARLVFGTPLRLQTGGQLNPCPSVSDLIRAAVRRIRVLSHFYGDNEIVPNAMSELMTAAANTSLLDQRTRWHEIPRRSTRQGVDMKLSGTVGHVDMMLPDGRLIPWLKAACVCHLGKATSFGYGRLELSLEEP
ncbi:MAG: CRISPR system precrRNA processing endoribonuclease RAMP protein Cas6 [Phycisphaerae bacterium]